MAAADAELGCRKLPDRGWEDIAAHIDPFLADAIRAIAAEYAGEPVPWLEINHWPDSGRLIVFPSIDGPHGDRGERVCCQLISDYLERECDRIGDTVPASDQQRAWDALARKVWDRVGECLLGGEAARELARARQTHRLRLAAYDYEFGEGLFHLPDLDSEAWGEMQAKLDEFKREFGVFPGSGVTPDQRQP